VEVEDIGKKDKIREMEKIGKELHIRFKDPEKLMEYLDKYGIFLINHNKKN